MILMMFDEEIFRPFKKIFHRIHLFKRQIFQRQQISLHQKFPYLKNKNLSSKTKTPRKKIFQIHEKFPNHESNRRFLTRWKMLKNQKKNIFLK